MIFGIEQGVFNLILLGLFVAVCAGQTLNAIYYTYKINNIKAAHDFHGHRLYEGLQADKMKTNALLAKMSHLEHVVDTLQHESETYRDQLVNLEASALANKNPKVVKELSNRVKKAIKSNKEARTSMKNKDIKSTRFRKTLKDHTIAPKPRSPKEMTFNLTKHK